jgi:hypothetical protein
LHAIGSTGAGQQPIKRGSQDVVRAGPRSRVA